MPKCKRPSKAPQNDIYSEDKSRGAHCTAPCQLRMSMTGTETSTVERALLLLHQQIELQREQQDNNRPRNGKSPITAEDLSKDQAVDNQLQEIQDILKTIEESPSLFTKSSDCSKPGKDIAAVPPKGPASKEQDPFDCEPYVNPWTGQWILPVTPYTPGPSSSETVSERSASAAAERSKAIIDRALIATTTVSQPSSIEDGRKTIEQKSRETREYQTTIARANAPEHQGSVARSRPLGYQRSTVGAHAPEHQRYLARSRTIGYQTSTARAKALEYQASFARSHTPGHQTSIARANAPGEISRVSSIKTVMPPAKLYDSSRADSDLTDSLTSIPKPSVLLKQLKGRALLKWSWSSNRKNKDACTSPGTSDERIQPVRFRTYLSTSASSLGRSCEVFETVPLGREETESIRGQLNSSERYNRFAVTWNLPARSRSNLSKIDEIEFREQRAASGKVLKLPQQDYSNVYKPNYTEWVVQTVAPDESAADVNINPTPQLPPSLLKRSAPRPRTEARSQQAPTSNVNRYEIIWRAREPSPETSKERTLPPGVGDEIDRLFGVTQSHGLVQKLPNEKSQAQSEAAVIDHKPWIYADRGPAQPLQSDAPQPTEVFLGEEATSSIEPEEKNRIAIARDTSEVAGRAETQTQPDSTRPMQADQDLARRMQEEWNAAEDAQLQEQLEAARRMQEEWNAAEDVRLQDEIEAARRMQEEWDAAELQDQIEFARRMQEEWNAAEELQLQEQLDAARRIQEEWNATEDAQLQDEIEAAQRMQDEWNAVEAQERAEQMKIAQALSEEQEGLEQAQAEAEEAERERLARQVDCIAGCDTKADKSEMAITTCDHAYCGTCIAQALQGAFAQRKLYLCCGRAVDIAIAEPFLSHSFATAYRLLAVETQTPNPLYCAAPTCSTFIPPARITGDAARCPSCRRTTCALCKQLAHGGVCATDAAGQRLLALAAKQNWQVCGRCKTVVEKAYGCLHMTCSCGFHFCYACGRAWGSVCSGNCSGARDWM